MTRRVDPSQTPAEGLSGSLLHQQLAALLDRGPGARRQLGVGRAADRMLDGRERIARHAQHAAIISAALAKRVVMTAEGGDAKTFGSDGVVQTAR